MFTTSSGDEPSSHLTDLQLPKPSIPDGGTPDRSEVSSTSSPLPRRGELQKNWALLRKLHRATLIARQQHFPPNPVVQSDGLDGLQALREVAQRGETQKAQPNGQSRVTIPHTPGLEPVDSYADPLAPLREQDLKALTAWFERDDMTEIAADVQQRLVQFAPEPCWEDDPFDFLREFL
ncbi:hypothetical protein K9N68_26985 [Kovacikia minuta CCNUW1]|uniref:hypothetical protein n=1 Tax=Kovacikia minuta TaxID=2931930 RepID=UPI001CC94C43|nr:hypothetical protein [Kovacikia minuta]UBF25229.1 hypothetical protein K9N68_26985 [Kovacikia minuta CCNUW1]